MGRQLLDYFLENGHQITMLSRDDAELPHSSKIRYYAFDVTSDETEFPTVDGPVHGLIYFPGTINLKPLRGISAELLRSDFEVNLVGFVRAVKAYLANLKKSGNASVVAFSSVAVQTGMAFHTSVAASKGAIEGVVRTMAAELAPKVRVNAIAPSLTNTPLGENFLNTEAKQKASAERHPLKRYGQPEDMAKMARFLLSDDSGWITGQVLGVDGGLSSIRNV